MVLTPVRQLILEVVLFSFQFKAFAVVLISTKKVICKSLDIVLSIFTNSGFAIGTESGSKIRKDETTAKECWKRWSILSVKAVTYWEHRSCIFASVASVLSSLNSGKASFPVFVSFRNSLTVIFSWTSLLSESLDALMAGEIREKDMKPFWNTLLRVESKAEHLLRHTEHQWN